MPEMDGLTALKEIKTMDGCQSHHGVGDGAAGAFDSCGFYGAIDFIVKPFSKDRVREALLKLLPDERPVFQIGVGYGMESLRSAFEIVKDEGWG